MHVNSQAVHPFDPDKFLGVGIGIPDENRPNQRHVGIIYQADQSGPRICHLAWHCILKDEPLPASYHWGYSGLDDVNKVVMAAYVALLKQNARSVPYGISYIPEHYFDEQGRYIVQPVGYGLTCATFILAVFARNGFELLQTMHWPNRPDDAEWQQQILDALAGRATPEHIEVARQDVGAKRFRPEEVAAGVISEFIPLDFPTAEKTASEILRDIYE